MTSTASHSTTDVAVTSTATPASSTTSSSTCSSSSSAATNVTTQSSAQPAKSAASDVSPATTPASQASSTLPLSANAAPKFGTLIPNRIFVGGIPANTTEDELKTFFSSFGPVKDTKIINDRAGISKGCVKPYGFVTFENQESADKVIRNEADNLIFKERKLNIGHAIRKQQALARQEPPGPVFFTSGSVPVPYTYQNGMAIFHHVPGQDYPFLPATPQPPSYAATMMLPQLTVYSQPHPAPPPSAVPGASFQPSAAAPVLPAPAVVPNLAAAVSQASATHWTAASANSHAASGVLSSVGQPWNSGASPAAAVAAAGLTRPWTGAASASAPASSWSSNQFLPSSGPAGTPLLYPTAAAAAAAAQSGALFALDPHQLLSTASSGGALDYQHAAAVAAAASGSHDDVTSAGGGLDLPSAKRRRFEAPTGSPVTPVYYSHSAAAAYH